MFDMTGQIVNPGSPASFLLLMVIFGIGLFVYSKLNHPGYEKIEDAVKKAVREDWPQIRARLEQEVAELRRRVDELTKK